MYGRFEPHFIESPSNFCYASHPRKDRIPEFFLCDAYNVEIGQSMDVLDNGIDLKPSLSGLFRL